MSNMSDWAKREVELACKAEAANKKDGDWDYGVACYESALKAYESLLGDGHSGMSFSITQQILSRLMDGKPLTPIEDVPEVWNDVSDMCSWKDGWTKYQCNRMSSLFKDVSPTGDVRYSDVNRCRCESLGRKGSMYHGSLEDKILDKMYPIKMPYYPRSGRYIFKTVDYLTDEKNGDFDTLGILTLKHPDGRIEDIHRYFAADGGSCVTEFEGWREISKREFMERKRMHEQRWRNKILMMREREKMSNGADDSGGGAE